MILYLVTWEGDLTQFLVQALDKDEAVKQAMETNFLVGEVDEEIKKDMSDPTCYTAELVEWELLVGLFRREDCLGEYGTVLVFND